MKHIVGRSEGAARRMSRGWLRPLAALVVLAVVVAASTAVRMHQEGYFFRGLNPTEWWLRGRGIYRYDPARHIVRQGAPGLPMVALTFDDGPHPSTPALLDILKAEDVHATFFLVGSNVVRYPALVRRMAAEGHDLANHTRTHLRLPPLRDDQIRNEIEDDTIVIARATGKRVRLFRPPGGEYDARVTDEAAREGLMTILWSNNTGDWQAKDPKWIENRVLSNVEDGDIILMHEAYPQTRAALPGVIAGLRRRGFRLVTVSEMLAASRYRIPPLPVASSAAAHRSGAGDQPVR